VDLHTHNSWQGQWHEIDGTEYYFYAGKDTYDAGRAHLPGFWTGSEGLAHPLRDRSGKKYILKSFTCECPERRERMQWLCSKSLCACHPLLGGAPYKYVGPPIEGQVCPFIEGVTWDRLKDDASFSLTSEDRLWLAFGLAEAVRLLEGGLDMSHSDLSPGNMLIHKGGGGRPAIALIDFDAFCHGDVPTLPVGKGQTLGTPGYQAPESLEASTIIRSDRFSMAIHIHEILAFGVDPDLGEPEHVFFEQAVLNRRKAEPTPRFRKYWGNEVSELFLQAVRARTVTERPSPSEWCDAFRGLGTGPPPQAAMLITAELDRDGKRVRRRFKLLGSKVDMGAALKDPQVGVRLARSGHVYQATVESQACLAILHDAWTGRDSRLDGTPRPVTPGSTIVVAGWKFTFHAGEESREASP
jgi:hypothetical protein